MKRYCDTSTSPANTGCVDPLPYPTFSHQTISREACDLWESDADIFDEQPCIGISRLKRWRRAHMLNLNPPIEVLAVLLRDQNGVTKQRAYVDELMS